MDQQKAWLAPVKRAVFLVAIRGILALLPLLAGGLLVGGTLQDGILIFMCLLLGLPWFVLMLLIGVLAAILPDIVKSSLDFLVPFAVILSITVPDCVLAFVFILAKNRKARWISFAIHSALLLFGAMFCILFVLAAACE